MRHCFALFLFAAITASAAEPVTVLRFGKLIDGRGGIVNDAVVVVRGDRIAAVGGPVPAGAKEIDLRKYTAIPGMIDAHTHMTFYWDRAPGTKPPCMRSSCNPLPTCSIT